MELVQLVKGAQQGDQGAYEEICRRFAGLVKKYAYQPHIKPVADEALAEGWLAVVQAVRTFDAESGVPFAGYVESKIKYAVWNLFKRERRHWQHEAPLQGSDDDDKGEVLDIIAADIDVAQAVENSLLADAVMTAIRRLPKRQQFVLMATVLHGYKLCDVAQSLAISVQAVHNLRKRGLARLKRILNLP